MVSCQANQIQPYITVVLMLPEEVSDDPLPPDTMHLLEPHVSHVLSSHANFSFSLS